ncbi:MAG: glycosyltransferase [bacterium]
MSKDSPFVSVIIPSLDGYCKGNVPKLLESLKQQSFQDFEVIVMKGDKRQGRAINAGVKKAKGEVLIILDDDTILGHKDVFRNLLEVINNDATIGMAGVANLIPPDAPWLVRRAMKELPRRSSKLVQKITDSDMAEHPCCAIPRKIFLEIGGESEVIPRGLDPYLRHKIRQAGYRVVVIPDTWIHHLLPNSFWTIMRRCLKNGKTAAYCNKFYPELIYNLSHRHNQQVRPRIPLIWRIFRYLYRMLLAFISLRWIWLSAQICNGLGFIWGWVFVKKEDI